MYWICVVYFLSKSCYLAPSWFLKLSGITSYLTSSYEGSLACYKTDQFTSETCGEPEVLPSDSLWSFEIQTPAFRLLQWQSPFALPWCYFLDIFPRQCTYMYVSLHYRVTIGEIQRLLPFPSFLLPSSFHPQLTFTLSNLSSGPWTV